MDKIFALNKKGFKIKVSTEGSSYVVTAAMNNVMLDGTGETLEDAVEKCYFVCMSFLDSIKK